MEDKSNLYQKQLSKLLDTLLVEKNKDLIESVDVDIFIRNNIYMVGVAIIFHKKGFDNLLRNRLLDGIYNHLGSLCSMIIPDKFSIGWVKKYVEGIPKDYY